jgi:hypothetical protein
MQTLDSDFFFFFVNRFVFMLPGLKLEETTDLREILSGVCIRGWKALDLSKPYLSSCYTELNWLVASTYGESKEIS